MDEDDGDEGDRFPLREDRLHSHIPQFLRTRAAARNEKPGSKDLEEEVNGRQDAITQMKKESSRLTERKQKSSIGVLKEEALLSGHSGLRTT